MDIQEKTKLGLRVLKYFEGIGCEIQLVGRSMRNGINSPSVLVYRIKGDWSRRFQDKVELFKYMSARYEITHEKFLAGFAEWYCSPRTVNSLQHLIIESDGDLYMPIANSLEELSLQMAVHGY